MTLKPMQCMNITRAIHGMCQLGDMIYTVGGTMTNDENSSLNKAERFDTSSERWTSISDCKYKTSGSCLVASKDKHIIKIGGKLDIFTPCTAIEVYDIARDLWVHNLVISNSRNLIINSVGQGTYVYHSMHALLISVTDKSQSSEDQFMMLNPMRVQ